MLFKTAQAAGSDTDIVTVADSGYYHRIDPEFISHFNGIVAVESGFITFLVAFVLDQFQQLFVSSVSH